jgi:adenylate kinase
VRVVLTGTPGTGKTTAAERLPYEVVHLNEAVTEEQLWTERDDERDSLVADVDALREWVDEHVGGAGEADEDGAGDASDNGDDDSNADEVVVLESHLAHLLDADRVVVLRCRPDVLESRLRERGESVEKAQENAESEALDVILSEAVGDHGTENVYEIDTTDRSPEDVAAEIERVVTGDREPSAGGVDFIDYLHS